MLVSLLSDHGLWVRCGILWLAFDVTWILIRTVKRTALCQTSRVQIPVVNPMRSCSSVLLMLVLPRRRPNQRIDIFSCTDMVKLQPFPHLNSSKCDKCFIL